MESKKSPYGISILKILDESFSLYLSRIESLFPVFLLLNILNMILAYIAGNFMPPLAPPNEAADGLFIWLINYGFSAAIVFSIFFLAIWVTTNVGSAFIIKVTSDIFEGRRANARENFSSVTHLLGGILTLNLTTGALMILGFILLLFPGLLMAIIFSLATPIMVIERLNVLDSLRRSKELTDNAWWKVFLLLLSISLIFIMAILFTEVFSLSFYAQRWLKEVFRVIIVSLVEPVYPISLTQLYYRLKKHKTIPVTIEYPSVESEIKFCHYCGQVLPYDAIYCPNCGRKIESKF